MIQVKVSLINEEFNCFYGKSTGDATVDRQQSPGGDGLPRTMPYEGGRAGAQIFMIGTLALVYSEVHKEDYQFAVDYLLRSAGLTIYDGATPEDFLSLGTQRIWRAEELDSLDCLLGIK